MNDITELKIGIFAYNFEHKKTQDFLIRSFLEGLDIRAVIAADKVELEIPSSAIRSKVRHRALIHPRDLSARLGFPFHNLAHDSDELVKLLKELELDVGIVAGARILDKKIIDLFSRGIINFHPGLIPEVRGLDAMLWSIWNDIPLGVTAHLIDERVDAGEVLLRKRIDIYEEDTIFDLSERIYEVQLELLRPTLEALLAGDITEPDYSGSTYNRKMPPELERKVLEKVEEYVKIFSN